MSILGMEIDNGHFPNPVDGTETISSVEVRPTFGTCHIVQGRESLANLLKKRDQRAHCLMAKEVVSWEEGDLHSTRLG